MGEIVFAGLAPHPPIIVREVGGIRTQDVKETIMALESWAKDLAASEPDVLVIISPHAPVFQDAIGIHAESRLKGSFAPFGVPQVKFDKEIHLPLVETIRNKALQKGINIASIDKELARELKIGSELDHGTMVPLYFIEKQGLDIPLVVISMGFLPFKELYSFGMAVREAIGESDLKVAVVASGDLSHRLTPDAPAGYDEKGREFDLKLKELLEKNAFLDILQMPHELTERAGECGLRPIIMLLGALDGYEVDTSVLSYEGPFGVGYMVARFDPVGKSTSLYKDYLQEKETEMQKLRESESLPVQIARKSLQKYLAEGTYLTPPKDIPSELSEKAGCFVSLKKAGMLRGCIGTVKPTQPTVCEEIIHNAVSAGTRDPRFNPVRLDELPELEISVDILLPPKPVKSREELDPKKYGVIVKKGFRSGLLLPNLEGVNSVEEQLGIALQKAGIRPDEDYKIERFEVRRYH